MIKATTPMNDNKICAGDIWVVGMNALLIVLEGGWRTTLKVLENSDIF